MPVLRMRNAEDEVNHLGGAFLGLHQSFRGLGVDGTELGFSDAATGVFLWENTGPVGETVHNGGIELSQHEAKSFLELPIDDHMLIDAEEPMREVLKGLDGEVKGILPVIAV